MRRRLLRDDEPIIQQAKTKATWEDDDDGPELDEEFSSVSETIDRWADLRKIAGEFTSFLPASEVLSEVIAVPTIFPQFDFATRIGGLPIERFMLVHGPSAGGKTYWIIGLILSFLMRNHAAVLIDAERTTPIRWLRLAMGAFAEHPFFFADRPTTYEATVKKVREFVNKIRKLREKGLIKDDTSALLVVDSIRKLIPEDQFKRIMQMAQQQGGKKEKLRDRSAQIKAAMNAAWMDELIPLLEETGTALVAIARETEDPDADQWAKAAGRNYKVGGGRAIYYDASMNMRVERLRPYGKKVEVNGRKKVIPYGDLHQVTITKSKVSGKGEDLYTSCEFHISNGRLVPAGFDRARDVLELARRLDIVEGTGQWLKYKTSKWQGVDKAVEVLTKKADLLEKLETDCRIVFSQNKDYLGNETPALVEVEE